jgi:uncharacterized protein (DUF1330 family)
MAISMCVLLWAVPNQRDALTRYEDTVLALLPEHGGRVVRRVPTVPEVGRPDEIQFLEFASSAGIESFMADARRTALERERAAAISRTEVLYLTESPAE